MSAKRLRDEVTILCYAALSVGCAYIPYSEYREETAAGILPANTHWIQNHPADHGPWWHTYQGEILMVILAILYGFALVSVVVGTYFYIRAHIPRARPLLAARWIALVAFQAAVYSYASETLSWLIR
jgi:hypothetical protein